MLFGEVSSKSVVAKVIRDLHLQDADRWVSMIEWIGEALAFIGAFDQFVNRTIFNLEVKNKRALLPCDLYSIVQISRQGIPLQYLGGSFDFSFHCEGSPNLKTKNRQGYTIEGQFINLNFNDTTINLAYQAFNTDKEGWPMLPDEVSFKEACFRYIVMKMRYPDWELGRISDIKYEKIEERWHFYCAQARGVANMPNIDQMEAMKNFWNRLIPNIHEHDSFFNNLGVPVPSQPLFAEPSDETITAIG